MAAAPGRPRAGVPLSAVVALGLASLLGACGSAARPATHAGAALLDAATQTLLRSAGFHVVFVDGDGARTVVADVSGKDATGTLLVGAQAFPFRVLGDRVLLRAPATAPWTAVAGDDALLLRGLPARLTGLVACVDGAHGRLVDRGAARVDGQRARRLELTTAAAGIEAYVSEAQPSHLVRYVQHRPHGGAPPPGCPGGEITVDVSAVRPAGR
jgi:hypothetical protein